MYTFVYKIEGMGSDPTSGGYSVKQDSDKA